MFTWMFKIPRIIFVCSAVSFYPNRTIPFALCSRQPPPQWHPSRASLQIPQPCPDHPWAQGGAQGLRLPHYPLATLLLAGGWDGLWLPDPALRVPHGESLLPPLLPRSTSPGSGPEGVSLHVVQSQRLGMLMDTLVVLSSALLQPRADILHERLWVFTFTFKFCITYCSVSLPKEDNFSYAETIRIQNGNRNSYQLERSVFFNTVSGFYHSYYISTTQSACILLALQIELCRCLLLSII